MRANTIKTSKLFLSLYILLLLIGCVGLTKITIGSDTRVLFAESNKHMQNFFEFEDRFSPGNYAVIGIESKSSYLDDSQMSILNELTQEFWKIPKVLRVDSLANHQFVYGTDSDIELIEAGNSFSELIEKFELPASKILEGEPLVINRLVSDDFKTALVIVNFNLDRNNPDHVQQAIDNSKSLLKDFEEAYGVSIFLGGDIASMATYKEAAIRDALTLIPIGLLIALLITLFFVGDIKHLKPLLFNLGGATVVGAGMTGWLGEAVNPATTIAPLVIFAIVTASSTHILMAFQREIQSNFTAACSRTISNTFPPIIVANLFTILGFTSLLFSSSPPIRMLGLMTISGVLTSIFGYLSIYVYHMKVDSKYSPPKLVSKTNDCLTGLVSSCVKRPVIVLFSFAVFSISVAYGVSHLKFNEAFMEFFDDSYDFRLATDFIEDNTGGAQIFDYTVFAKDGGSVLDPEYIATISKFENWLKEQDRVSNVSSIVPIVRRINSAMNSVNHDYTRYPIPDDREVIAQYILLYEMSLPFGLDLTSIINQQKTASRISFALKDVSSEEIRHLAANIKHWFSVNASSYKIDLGTGVSMMFAYLATDIAKDVFMGVAISLVLICIFLAFTLRSFVLVVFVLFANVLPIAAIFGTWGIFNGDIGIAASVVIAMVLGVAIDDSIIFIWALGKAIKTHSSSRLKAVKEAIREVGAPMLASTLALSAGFGVMYFSGFQVTSDLGVFSASIVVAAFLFDLIFLPSLFTIFQKETLKEGALNIYSDSDSEIKPDVN